MARFEKLEMDCYHALIGELLNLNLVKAQEGINATFQLLKIPQVVVTLDQPDVDIRFTWISLDGFIKGFIAGTVTCSFEHSKTTDERIYPIVLGRLFEQLSSVITFGDRDGKLQLFVEEKGE